MFMAVLIGVIAYLVACYGYGLYLIARLYTGRRFHGEGAVAGETRRPYEKPQPRIEPETYEQPRAKAA